MSHRVPGLIKSEQEALNHLKGALKGLRSSTNQIAVIMDALLDHGIITGKSKDLAMLRLKLRTCFEKGP